MSNAVSSLIFAFRNVDKTKGGEIGRAPVAAAQGLKVVDSVAHYNKTVEKGADAAIRAFNNLSKKSKAFDYAVKGTRWAVKNVNPMICVSGGLKVAMSDDKPFAAIKEVAALSAMFAGEGIAKKVLPNLINKEGKLLNKVKVGGKMGAVIRGISFVGASIASYSAGEFLGKNLAAEAKANWSSGKINQMA